MSYPIADFEDIRHLSYLVQPCVIAERPLVAGTPAGPRCMEATWAAWMIAMNPV